MLRDKLGLVEVLCKVPPKILLFSPHSGPASRQMKVGHSNAKRTVRGKVIYPRVTQLGHNRGVSELRVYAFKHTALHFP